MNENANFNPKIGDPQALQGQCDIEPNIDRKLHLFVWDLSSLTIRAWALGLGLYFNS